MTSREPEAPLVADQARRRAGRARAQASAKCAGRLRRARRRPGSAVVRRGPPRAGGPRRGGPSRRATSRHGGVRIAAPTTRSPWSDRREVRRRAYWVGSASMVEQIPKIRLCSASRSARNVAGDVQEGGRRSSQRRISTTVEASARRTAPNLALSPLDEGVQRLGPARVERRRLVLGEELLPDAVRPLRGGPRAVLLPRLEVPPVGQERLVERGLVARERVRRAEEVPARARPRRSRRGPSVVVVDRRAAASTSAICWSSSASRISFSKLAVSPPSSQPAPW